MNDIDMKCFMISIYIHHMDVDMLFDFLHERVETPPPYWHSEASCPPSVSGGYVMVTLNYSQFDLLRGRRSWDFSEFDKNN